MSMNYAHVRSVSLSPPRHTYDEYNEKFCGAFFIVSEGKKYQVVAALMHIHCFWVLNYPF